MRPGQLEPNDFELAILERIAAGKPLLRAQLGHLHVLSREFTGVGSYTKFKCAEAVGDAAEEQLDLDGSIVMPNVQNGMGAILFCRGGQPKCLETYTYGSEFWDGLFDGFSINGSASPADH